MTYTSSNEKVATVSNGTVTGVSAGNATITIKTKNGHEETFEVTVTEVEVESISLDKETLKVGPGKTSEALNVTFTPANATNKTITWSSNPETVATVSDGKVTGVAEGTATITATSANGKTATCNVTVAEVGMTIAEAKAAVQKDGLQAHIGDLVEYNPTAGGKWRIFYYDEAGDFGTAGKLYLKRDYDSSLKTSLNVSGTYTNTDEAIIKMKAMNPKWAASTNASSIDLNNEKAVAWLCNPANWTNYKTAEVDYAIGAPSVEMYMKAYNVWKDNNKDSTTLICKIGSAVGYSVGTNGTYDYNSGYSTSNTIEVGPNNIFMTARSDYWMASPSSGGPDYVLLVSGTSTVVNFNSYSREYGVCPIVSIK